MRGDGLRGGGHDILDVSSSSTDIADSFPECKVGSGTKSDATVPGVLENVVIATTAAAWVRVVICEGEYKIE